MADPKEAILVVRIMLLQQAKRCQMLTLPTVEGLCRVSPKIYHEMMEDAEEVIEALDQHRAERK